MKNRLFFRLTILILIHFLYHQIYLHSNQPLLLGFFQKIIPSPLHHGFEIKLISRDIISGQHKKLCPQSNNI